MIFPRYLTVLGFLAIGIASRLLPHPPNFTAMNALALFGAFFLKDRRLSCAMLFLTQFLGDLVLGFHSTLPYVYFSFGLIFFLGGSIRRGLSWIPLSVLCLSSSLLFFFVTNFGVWMNSQIYPKTVQGLGFCYTAAIPFFANQLMGDIAYAAVIFGIMALTQYSLKRRIS